MLDKCENGLDLDTEAGKIELLKRTSSVLAGMESPLEREIYISRTSKKCDIPTDVLRNHVNEIINNSKRQNKKNTWKSIKSNITKTTDSINPESVKFPKESRAEENIIRFLIKQPEEYQNIYNIIPPEKFVTTFNKKVYTAILECIKNNNNFSLSMLTEMFTPDEMGRISGIDAKNRDTEINIQVCQDCAEVLKKSGSIKTNDDLSIDELQKLFDSKK